MRLKIRKHLLVNHDQSYEVTNYKYSVTVLNYIDFFGHIFTFNSHILTQR